jgi:hypothetical protein
LNFSASEVTTDDAKTHLNVTDDMVSDFILTVYFADGTSDMMYYPNTYFDAKDVKLVDNSSLSCGANNCEIIIGDIVSTYNVNITHSYAEKDVEPTPDEDGYTLHYCILCNEGCKDNFVQTTSFTVYGNCVLAETPFNEHSIDLPYDKATIRVDGREYSINSDGTWEIHTFDSCTIVFDNPYGNNMTIRVSIDNSDVNYGTIVLCGYDLNQDGHINAKDYVLYKRDYKNEFSKDYFRFIEEFLIYY